jgi:hypothetical protein
MSSHSLHSLLSDVLDAWAARARGEVDEAIMRFAASTPVTAPDGLQWTLWESLAAERLALAQLRMETGDYEGSLQAAAALDQPQSIVYVAFVDDSLRLCVQAAEALGRVEQADLCRDRLRRLRPDLPRLTHSDARR